MISQIYFWNKTVPVWDSSSVHHQEFFTVHTAVVYVIQVCWQLESELSASNRVALNRNMPSQTKACIAESSCVKKKRQTRAWLNLTGTNFFFYLCPVHFEIYAVPSPTNSLFTNLVKSFKFTLKYTIISLLHVSVFNDHHQGALSVPN